MSTGESNHLPLVLVGGTGRSGTTILARILGQHPRLFSLPTELRFITDPGGLISLHEALVTNWSFFQAESALSRFERLLRCFSGKFRSPYPLIHLDHLTGKQFYRKWSADFVSAFTNHLFKCGWAGRISLIRKVGLRFLGRNRMTEWGMTPCRYASPLTDHDFFAICRVFLAQLVCRIAERQEADLVVDHTPSNIIHANFWSRLMPQNMRIIHIFRDPRDVIASFSLQQWGSRDPLENMRWIHDVLQRWNSLKHTLPADQVREIRFEDLIRNPEQELRGLSRFLGIPFVPAMLEMDLSRHHIGRWEGALSREQLALILEKFPQTIATYAVKEDQRAE